MEELRIKISQLSRKLKLKLKLNFANHEDFESVSEPPDILNKKLKYLQENIDPAALKKFLSKNDPSKSSKSKSISSQIAIFKQLNKKIMNKPIFLTQK